MPRLFLYPFRYRHPLTGKWTSARYVARSTRSLRNTPMGAPRRLRFAMSTLSSP